MTTSRFAWLEPATQLPHDLTLAVGPGYCTEDGGDGAYASVAQMRAGGKPGHLVSATALAHLRDGADRRWVLVRRDESAEVEAALWQFPAVRLNPAELPLQAACRSVAQKITLIQQGHEISWADANIRVGGDVVAYLRDDKVDHLKARYVFAHNTVEFYYPMELVRERLDTITVADRERYERPADAFTYGEIEDMVKTGQMTTTAAALWAAAKAEGCLVFS